MFGLRFVTTGLAVLLVVTVSNGQVRNDYQGENNVPQKDMFLIRPIEKDQESTKVGGELQGMDDGPASSLLVRRLKGESEGTREDETIESENLERHKRGIKKSAKKGGGGGGGKGGCKKGRK